METTTGEIALIYQISFWLLIIVFGALLILGLTKLFFSSSSEGRSAIARMIRAKNVGLEPKASQAVIESGQRFWIALMVVLQNSNGEVVYQQLEETIDKTGLPRAIVADHESDVKSGIERFVEAHPQTSDLYDIKHKAAALLKSHLKNDGIWKSFTQQASQTKSQVQQTALSFIASPNQRTKARYMNLAVLVRWGNRALVLLDHVEKKTETRESYEKINLGQQHRHLLVVIGYSARTDRALVIDADVQFLPAFALLHAVLLGMPFTLTADLQAATVNDQGYRSLRRTIAGTGMGGFAILKPMKSCLHSMPAGPIVCAIAELSRGFTQP